MNVYTYRGYQYDKDTGFYYLQSRYYDPEVGRFLNADDTSFLGATGTTLGYNLYSYCENNVINNVDPNGQVTLGFKLKLSAVAGISYGLYKTTSLIGTKLNARGLAKVAYNFAQGFMIGFVTVMSFFSLSKKLLVSVAFGIMNIAYGLALGNVRTAGELLTSFIDGYGGHLSPGLLSNKGSFLYETIKFLCQYLAIDVG